MEKTYLSLCCGKLDMYSESFYSEHSPKFEKEKMDKMKWKTQNNSKMTFIQAN